MSKVPSLITQTAKHLQAVFTSRHMNTIHMFFTVLRTSLDANLQAA